MIPLPELHLDVSGNTCCTGNKSSRVIYNEDQRKFEIRDVNFLCCVCGGKEIVRDENSRTWEAFMKALQDHYGIDPRKEVPERHNNWQRLKSDRKKLTLAQFEHFVEWAQRIQQERSRSGKPLHRVRSINVHLDVRVRSDSGMKEEPFNAEILAGDLRKSPSSKILSESQIDRIVELVIEELRSTGRREVSKTEIAQIVQKKMSQVGDDEV